MNAQDLKNSILQLAIQGKLVEQKKEEGTAKELLEQIKAEKEQLIKEGKIKKEKPLAEITEDEIPFEIPESWEWVRVVDVVKITTGNKDANHGNEDGQFDFFTCSKEPIKSKTYSYEGECILLPGNGANVGLSIYYEGKFEVYQRTYVLEKITNDFQMKYLQVALEWNWKRYNSNKMFGSAIPYIKIGNLQDYVFPLPPLEEQKRIVAKIEELIPYIDKYGESYLKLEALNKKFPEDIQKSILQYAIQGKLVEQREEEGLAEDLYQQIQEEKARMVKEGKIKKDKPLSEITEDEIPFEIPESWKWVRLGDVIKLLSGQDFPPDKYNDTNNGIPYITGASSLSSDGVIINRWTNEPRCIAETGDVLIVCKGSGYGKTVICDVEKAHIARQIMSIKRSNLLEMEYLKIFMEANFTQIKRMGQGVIPGIDRGSINNIMFPLPPLGEQMRIVLKLRDIVPLCCKLIK